MGRPDFLASALLRTLVLLGLQLIVRIVPVAGSPREVQATLTARSGVIATWTAINDVAPGMFVAQVRTKAR